MTHSPLVIILLGPPGVGKGTQASKLCHHLKLPHISTGEILRTNIKSGTALGKKTQAFIEAGQLVPSELINELVEDRIRQSDCAHGFLLDGYPRTESQAHFLEKLLEKKATPKVINYQAHDITIIERLGGRLTCKQCDASFHSINSPPKIKDRCDHCHSDLIKRKDDEIAVIQERLKAYQAQTEPLIHYYKKKGLLVVIPCEGSVDDIFKATLHALSI